MYRHFMSSLCFMAGCASTPLREPMDAGVEGLSDAADRPDAGACYFVTDSGCASASSNHFCCNEPHQRVNWTRRCLESVRRCRSFVGSSINAVCSTQLAPNCYVQMKPDGSEETVILQELYEPADLQSLGLRYCEDAVRGEVSRYSGCP